MKRLTFFAAALLLLASCATTSSKPFTVDPRSPSFPVGSLSVQSDKLLSGEVQAQQLALSYFPIEDAVCIQFRADFVYYYLYLNQLGRDTFLSALDLYKADYEIRNLNAKAGPREKRLYGKVNGFLGWQVGSFLSTPAFGSVEVNYGYAFKGPLKNKTPYFSITQNQTEFESEEIGHKVTSAKVWLYFTRAQADELAALFDQEFLTGLGGGAARAGMGVQREEERGEGVSGGAPRAGERVQQSEGERGEVKTVEEAFFEGAQSERVEVEVKTVEEAFFEGNR